MGALDQVMQMKATGMPDSEISSQLLSQGIPPKQIQDALAQASIKSAVSPQGNIPAPVADIPMPQVEPEQAPSIMPQTQPTYTEDYGQGQDYGMQETGYYPQEGYDYAPTESASDTIIEISEQVFDEKIKNIQKKVDALTEFKTISETKIQTIDDRLKRIETTMIQLESAVLKKVGSYTTTLDSIKNEMSMMQNSFSKVAEKALKKPTHSTTKKISKK